MTNDREDPPESFELWTNRRPTLTADRHLAAVLGSVKNLPMRYWRPFFFFMGTRDADLIELTGGRFPATTRPGKTHPVIALEPLPDNAGYKVSPCSSSRPWKPRNPRFIRKGCRLAYTGHAMDRNSFVVEDIEVPIPPQICAGLVFKGGVPAECIQSAG